MVKINHKNMKKSILIVMSILIIFGSIFVIANTERLSRDSILNIINYRLDKPNVYQEKGIIFAEYDDLKCNITFSHTSNITFKPFAHGTEFSYVMDMPDVKFEPEIIVSCKGEITEKDNKLYYGNFILDFTTLEKEVNISKYSKEIIKEQKEIIAFDLKTEIINKNSYKILPTLKTGYSFKKGDKIVLDPIIEVINFDNLNIITTNVTIEGNFSHISISNSVPYDSLVAYWNFDGDTENTKLTTHYDFTSNNYDGTGVADAVVNETDAVYGDALQLDGIGDYVNIPSPPNLTDAFSISMWFKQDSYKQSRALIDTDYADNYLFGYFYSNTLRFYVHGTSLTSTKNDFDTDVDWHHIVGIWNTTHILLYIDGVSGATPVAQTTAPVGQNYMYIGQYANSKYFNGTIDEVMIFNTSLNSSQILDIYNNQSARFRTNGTQKNMTFNMTLDTDWIHFAFPNAEQNFDSSIDFSVGEWNGTEYDYGSWQTIDNPNYQVTNYSATNFSLGLRLNAGNSTDPFYTSIVKTSTAEPISGASNNSITNCSYLLTANTVYTLQNDISTTTTCFTILANNITLDLAGYNITGDEGSGDYGVLISGYNDTTIKNGFIYDFGRGISSTNGYNGNFSNLVIITDTTNDGVYYGFYVSGGENNSIESNNISIDPPVKAVYGIYFSSTSDNLIQDNYIYDTFGRLGGDGSAYGIYLTSSSDNQFIRNTIANTTCESESADGYAIYLVSSPNNRFSDSNFSDSKTTDVYITTSLNNTFLNCSYSSEVVSPIGSGLIRKWWYKAYVNDTSGNDVADANVTANNVTSDYQFNLTTNASGWTEIEEIIDYINNGTTIHSSLYTIYAQNLSYPTISHTYNVTANQNNYKDVFTLDNINPVANLTYPLNGSYNKTVAQNFTYNASDNLELKNATLYLFNQSSGVVTEFETTFPANTLTDTIGLVISLVDGIYKWWVSVWDTAGNIHTSENYTLTIDTIAPKLNITYPTINSSSFTFAGFPFNISLNLTATDTGGVGFDSYWWSYNNGTTNHTFRTNKTSMNWTWAHDFRTTQTYHRPIWVWVNDSANNINRTSINLTITMVRQSGFSGGSGGPDYVTTPTNVTNVTEEDKPEALPPETPDLKVILVLFVGLIGFIIFVKYVDRKDYNKKKESFWDWTFKEKK